MHAGSRHSKTRLTFFMLGLLLLLGGLSGILFGAVNLPFSSILFILGGGDLPDSSAHLQLILTELRFPRVLLAMLVGANLAICGAVSQGLFRNPLADPSLIGVTAGASLGASIAIVSGVSFSGSLLFASTISFGAFVGGLLTVLLVYRISSNANGTSVATMLLTGIAVTAFTAAITGLLDFYADNESLRRMSLWRMGGLEGANYSHVVLASIVLLVILSCFQHQAQTLNTLLLGESEARHLGINVEQSKTRLILLIAAGTGCAVALAGTIAFIGLVVPHIIRLVIGPNHRFLLPASAMGGAVLLVLADTFARTAVAPTELPVGLISALLGAPFFLSLLRHRYDY